jgi:hypothetical protein
LSFDGRPASRVAQESSGSWGALSFGYLFFGQAKKSNSLKSEKQHHKQPQNPRGQKCPRYNDKSKEQPFIAIPPRLDSTPRQNDT